MIYSCRIGTFLKSSNRTTALSHSAEDGRLDSQKRMVTSNHYHPHSNDLSFSSQAICMTHEEISIPEGLPSYNEEICSYETA